MSSSFCTDFVFTYICLPIRLVSMEISNIDKEILAKAILESLTKEIEDGDNSKTEHSSVEQILDQ